MCCMRRDSTWLSQPHRHIVTQSRRSWLALSDPNNVFMRVKTLPDRTAQFSHKIMFGRKNVLAGISRRKNVTKRTVDCCPSFSALSAPFLFPYLLAWMFFHTVCADSPLQPFGPTAARTLSSAALRGGQAGQPSWLWRSSSAQPSPLRPSAAHSAADFPSPLQPFWTRSCVRPLLCGAARWEGRPAELALAQRLSPTFPVPPERHTQRLSPPPIPTPQAFRPEATRTLSSATLRGRQAGQPCWALRSSSALPPSRHLGDTAVFLVTSVTATATLFGSLLWASCDSACEGLRQLTRWGHLFTSTLIPGAHSLLYTHSIPCTLWLRALERRRR